MPKNRNTNNATSQAATKAVNLTKGLVPLFRSGAVSSMTPVAVGKTLKSVYQWRFLPGSLLAISAGRDPYHSAIIDDSGSMTYLELHEQTNTLARALFRSGIRERDRIGVLCRNHRGLIMALCAHGRLGTDIVFFNTGSSAAQTRAVIREQEIDVLFIDEEFLPLLSKDFNDCHVIIAWEFGDSLGHTRETEAALPQPSNISDAVQSGDFATRNPDWPSLNTIITTTPENLTIPSRPRQGRCIILTSGTTGTPKGARRPEPRGYMPASSIMSRIPLRHHRPVFLAAPMFHTWGFAHIQLSLLLRNTMILQRRFDPAAAVQLIEKNRPYAMSIVPTMLRRLLAATPENFNSNIKVIASSGEAIPPHVIEETQAKYGDVLYNLYGSTEVSWASIATPADLRVNPRTAGKPPLATTLKILDDNGVELPEGEVGRVFVKNDMLFEGYTRPGADKESIDGMIATGDLGYYDGGLLYISGRSDDMIVSGGENVYPQETENVVLTLPGVAEAAVRGVEDPDFGQALCAWVVLEGRSADSLSEDEAAEFTAMVKSSVKQKLARHAVPRHVVFLDELPRNAVGKVVPRDLPQP